MDELLKGERSENPKSEEEGCGESGDLREEIKRHLFTRGKDEPKHFSEKICGVLMRRAYALSSVWQATFLKTEKNKKVIGGRLLKKSRFYVILSKE